MTKICKKAAQLFRCAVSKVVDSVKSVALWSANIRKLAKGHKGYGSAANNMAHQIWIVNLNILYQGKNNKSYCPETKLHDILFLFDHEISPLSQVTLKLIMGYSEYRKV